MASPRGRATSAISSRSGRNVVAEGAAGGGTSPRAAPKTAAELEAELLERKRAANIKRREEERAATRIQAATLGREGKRRATKLHRQKTQLQKLRSKQHEHLMMEDGRSASTPPGTLRAGDFPKIVAAEAHRRRGVGVCRRPRRRGGGGAQEGGGEAGARRGGDARAGKGAAAAARGSSTLSRRRRLSSRR